MAGGGGDSGAAVEDDVPGGDLFAVEFFVGVVVGAEGGAFEGDTGEQATGAGVGEDFGAHGGIGGGGGIAAFGSGGGGGIGSEFDFAGEDAFGAAGVHDEEDEIGGLASQLEAEASAFESDHGRGAPGTVEVLAAAADHGAAAVATADAEGELEDTGKDDGAFGAIEEVLRDVVGDMEDLGDHFAGIGDALGFLLLRVGREKGQDKEEEQDRQRSHKDQDKR